MQLLTRDNKRVWRSRSERCLETKCLRSIDIFSANTFTQQFWPPFLKKPLVVSCNTETFRDFWTKQCRACLYLVFSLTKLESQKIGLLKKRNGVLQKVKQSESEWLGFTVTQFSRKQVFHQLPCGNTSMNNQLLRQRSANPQERQNTQVDLFGWVTQIKTRTYSQKNCLLPCFFILHGTWNGPGGTSWRSVKKIINGY